MAFNVDDDMDGTNDDDDDDDDDVAAGLVAGGAGTGRVGVTVGGVTAVTVAVVAGGAGARRTTAEEPTRVLSFTIHYDHQKDESCNAPWDHVIYMCALTCSASCGVSAINSNTRSNPRTYGIQYSNVNDNDDDMTIISGVNKYMEIQTASAFATFAFIGLFHSRDIYQLDRFYKCGTYAISLYI